MKLVKRGQNGLKTMHPYGPMYHYTPEYYQDFGIGNHPDFDEDFRSRYGLRYAPYNEIDFGDTKPDDIRVQNQGNVTAQAFQWENPSGTLLVGPDNRIINKQRLAELSNQYRADNADNLNRKYSALNGEKPAQPVAPEFWLLAGAAPKAAGALNSAISPLFNMAATDNIISDVSPYNGWGNMMAQNAGGPEWAWDLVHPAFAKDAALLTKYGLYIGSEKLKDATIKTAFNIIDKNAPRLTLIPQVKRGIEVAARSSEEITPGVYLRYFNRLKNTSTGRQQLRNVGKYILTGKKTPGKIPYRTLEPNGLEYTGFNDAPLMKGRTDLLDVYFYGKLLDDDVLTYLGKGPEADFGIHTDYINRTYPHKINDIQVYETLPRDFNVIQGEVLQETPGTYIRGQELDISPHMFTLQGKSVDVGGHLLLVDPNLKMWQYLDIWKFNPDEYLQKWGWKKTKDTIWPYLGLKLMDSAGTPIITRTPVYYGSKLPH